MAEHLQTFFTLDLKPKYLWAIWLEVRKWIICLHSFKICSVVPGKSCVTKQCWVIYKMSQWGDEILHHSQLSGWNLACDVWGLFVMEPRAKRQEGDLISHKHVYVVITLKIRWWLVFFASQRILRIWLAYKETADYLGNNRDAVSVM